MANRAIRLVVVTYGVSSAQYKFPCSCSAASQLYISRHLGYAGIVIEKGIAGEKSKRDRKDSAKTYGTQSLAWPDDKLWGSKPGVNN